MRIDDAVFVVIDTETTGLDSTKDELVEIGAVATRRSLPVLGLWAALIKPPCAIPPELSAIHGITDSDVASAIPKAEAYAGLAEFLNLFESLCAVTLAAHNAEFDRGFIMQPENFTDWLCTKRLAQHLWPDAPNHKNQTLRYWRNLNVETFGIAPHRALGDALVTAALLRDELNCNEFRATGIEDVESLLKYAASPIVIRKWPFGKYYDEPIDAAPASYMEWALRDGNISDDLRYTLNLELAVYN